MSAEEYFGDPKKIDIQYDTDDGSTHLVLCCAGHVDGSPETQQAFLDKLEGYLGHITSDSFQSQYPNTKVWLEVSFEEEPDQLILQLLYQCRQWVADNNAELRIKVDGRFGSIVEVDGVPES